MADSDQPTRVRGPFIMPDGRPLSAFLESQELRPSRGGSSGSGTKRRPGAVKEPKEGWTKPLPRAATAVASGSGQSEAEQAELYALSRVGQRKQRRWLNDKLLRDMAGNLTATEMANLFKPVPFGEQRSSLWEQAAQPEHAVLWDMFRQLDMDKQSRVLQKWEAHVRELQAGPAAIQNPAIDAIAAWASVSWKARQAMKRSSPSHVQAIECQIIDFMQQEEPVDEAVLTGLDDGFHRLIAHGLAEYHQLSSHSRQLADGSKQVVIRRRRAAASSGTGASVQPAAAAAVAPLAGVEAGDAAQAGPAPAAGSMQQGGQQQQGHGQQPLAISCSDILHILLDEDQPLNSRLLHQAYLHPVDSSSEAGDYHHVQQQQHMVLAAS